MNRNFKIDNSKKKDLIPEEFDLSTLLNFIRRNIKIISISTSFFIFLSLIIAYTSKKIWEGEFEIVLNKEETPVSGLARVLERAPNSYATTPLFSSALRGGGPSALRTEITILQSPFILQPIFNYVQDEYNKKGLNSELLFSKWTENNLKINLRDKTSVLKISYRDSNKELIIPVLSKISSAYQEYSGFKKRRGLELGKKYLNSQIDIFKKKTSESIKNLQAYTMDEDLALFTIDNLKGIEDISENQLSDSRVKTLVTSIESSRANAANNIRTLDIQIKKIESLNDVEQIIQFVNTEFEFYPSSNLKELLDINNEKILAIKTKYLVRDDNIQILKDERNILGQMLKEELIASLKAKKLLEEAKMQSATRPKEVIIKYQAMLREAERNEANLINLENQMSLLKLEESKIEDPWRLISNPQIKKNPISPVKKRIALTGLFAGIIFGSILSYIKEMRTGNIFEKEFLEKFFSSQIITTLIFKDEKIEENKIFNDLIISINSKIINFISIKELDIKIEPILKNFLKNYSSEDKTLNLISQNLSNLSEQDKSFLLLDNAEITFKEISEIKKRFDILGIEISGLIYID